MANVSKQDIKIKHKNHIPVEIILWKVKPGDQVQKDENIGQYDYISEEDGIQKQLAYPIRASTNGKIESLLPLNTIVESCEYWELIVVSHWE